MQVAREAALAELRKTKFRTRNWKVGRASQARPRIARRAWSSGLFVGTQSSRFFFKTHQHLVDADFRSGPWFAFFRLTLIAPFEFVFLFLLTSVFFLAFGECGSASG
jgi:hypothetical protein